MKIGLHAAIDEDVLNFIDQNGITGTYNQTNGTLQLSGSATLADYQAAIRSVTYTNTSENPSPFTRTLSITINDGDLGSNGANRLIELIPVNDAPILSSIEAQPANFVEGGTPVGLTGNISVEDIDDTDIESAMVAILSLIHI